MEKVGSKIITALIVISIVTNFALATEWRAYKNNSQHTGVATDALEPPLELFWKLKTEEPTTSAVVDSRTVYVIASARYAQCKGNKAKWKREKEECMIGMPITKEMLQKDYYNLHASFYVVIECS